MSVNKEIFEIVIVGHSGHSHSVIETITRNGKYTLIGYFDKIEKKGLNTLPYIGEETSETKGYNIFVTIGENKTRKVIYEKLATENNLGFSIIDKSANIADTTRVSSKQCFVAKNVIINSKSEIAKGCIINTGVIVEHDCNIGQFSHIAPGAVLCGNVRVGENTLIGANSTILPNITIGDNVTVGAGSVVTKNIPSNSIYMGNPAKPI